MAMDAELKAKWTAALRSGEFDQGIARLLYEGRHCCLGVLCVVKGMSDDEIVRFRGNYSTLHPEMTEDQTSRLWGMNDSGKSFAQIADYIDANL